MFELYDPDLGTTTLTDVPDDYAPAEGRQWFVIPDGFDVGKRMFVSDVTYGQPGSGRDSAAPTVLFVHGNPESSYTYRKTIAVLLEAVDGPIRIIAMDHIGFGLSDCATFEMVEMHHAANLRYLVDSLGLSDITLVVHDWGGPIGVGAFIADPHRVSALVVCNSTVFPMPAEGYVYTAFPVPFLIPWTYLGTVVPDGLWRWVASLVMYSPGSAVDFVFRHIPSFTLRALRRRLSIGERTYMQMFTSSMNARSSKRMVKQTGCWGHGYTYTEPVNGTHDNVSFYREIQDNLMPSWAGRIEARAFFGLWDPCGKDSVRAQWRAALPQLTGNTQEFEGVGHFVEEHRFAEIGAGIADVVSS